MRTPNYAGASIPREEWPSYVDLLPPHARSLSGMRIGLYLRISDDDEDEDLSRRGVRRQLADTILHAVRRGASELVLYEENDTSAWRKRRIKKVDSDGNVYFVYRVIRPVWQALLTDLRQGVLDGVVVYDIDRLARDNRDIEDAIELVEYYGKKFEGTTGSLDLMTDSGIAMARVMVAMANKSSADTARRVKRWAKERSEAGRATGSVRPFGMSVDKATLHPEESQLIKDAVARINAGVSVGAVLAEWQKAGVRTTRGNKWQWASMVQMLRNPRLCGLQGRFTRNTRPNGSQYDRWEIVTRPDGTEVQGAWEKIVDREDWDILISIIGQEDAPPKPEGSGRKYLLSGLAKCGLCGTSMCGSRVGGSFRYSCRAMINGGCGKITRSGPHVDSLIVKLAFILHDDASGRYAIPEEPAEWEGAAALRGVDEALAEAYAEWKGRKLESSAYFAIRRDLEKDRRALLKEQAAHNAGEKRGAVAANVRERWDDPEVTISEKAAFISQYISAVIIHEIPEVWDQGKKRMVRRKMFNPALIEPIAR